MVEWTEEARGVFALSLYDVATCAAIVERLKGLKGWGSAQVREWSETEGYQSTSRPEYRSASVLTEVSVADVVEGFDERMDRVVKPLIKKIWDVMLTEHSGTQLIRYGPGGHYIPHTDAGYDFQFRYFSVLCYLNDDYEGGRTSFSSLNYATVPRRGKAIIFPSQFFHCAEPVLKGEKYVLLSWVNGPVPIKWI